ncbi:hypothetical protein EJB05_22705, partial [Eragrostis curvula]
APLAPFSPLSLVSVPSLHTSRQPGELDAWRSEVPGEAQPPVDLFVGLAAGPVVIGLEPTGIPVELRRTWRPTLLHLPPPAACLLALYNLLVGKPGPGTGRHCVMAGAAQSLRGLPRRGPRWPVGGNRRTESGVAVSTPAGDDASRRERGHVGQNAMERAQALCYQSIVTRIDGALRRAW